MAEASTSSQNVSVATTTNSSPRSTTMERVRSSAFKFLPGAVAGCVQAVAGHPLDTIKTKMQASAFAAPPIPAQKNPLAPPVSEKATRAAALVARKVLPASASPAVATTITPTVAAPKTRLPGSVSAAAQIYAKDGVVGFYRGVTVPIYLNSCKRGMQYQIWDRLKEMKLDPFLSGSLTGAFGTVTFGCPGHVIKVHSQVIGDRNAFAAAKYVFERKGILGFYAGLPANLAKDIVFAGCYLGLYEKYKGMRPEASYAEAAAVASVFCWTVFLPFDTVKTAFQSPNRTVGLALLRNQTNSLRATVIQKSPPPPPAPVAAEFRGGPVRTFFMTLRRAWSGLAPALLRAGPANAASMTVYEHCKVFVQKREEKRKRIKT